MTPKEKAEELVNKMKYPIDGVYVISHVANELALIAVDQILEALDNHHWQNRNVAEYYREVKHEINNL
jgi:hypothetical protein